MFVGQARFDQSNGLRPRPDRAQHSDSVSSPRSLLLSSAPQVNTLQADGWAKEVGQEAKQEQQTIAGVMKIIIDCRPWKLRAGG
jgi:hypothetical protein